MELQLVVFLLIALAIYILLLYVPVHIAKDRGHQSLDGVKTLAVLSAFIPPLWLAAIIWACVGPTNKADNKAAFNASVTAAERETARIRRQEEGASSDVDAELEKALLENDPRGPSFDNERRAAEELLPAVTVEQDQCENCGRKIGKLETPQLWQEHVVCAECLARLKSQP